MAKTITPEMKKKAWDYGSQSKAHYDVLTSEQKKAFWEHGRDNKLYDPNTLDNYKKNEYSTYVKPIVEKPIVKPVIKKPVTLKPQAISSPNLQAQRTGVNGRPMPVLDQKKLDKASGVAGAFTANLVDSATLGLATKGLDKFEKGLGTKSLEDASKGHKVASTIGNLTGYALPFGVASKAVKPITKGITNKLAKTAVTGALEGALVGGSEGGIKGKNVVKSAAEMAALGAGGNLAIAGASKLIGKVLKPRVFETKVEPKVETPVKLKPTKITNKLPKNAELNNYYNNIDAQDYLNSSNPAYIEAENKLRISKGLKPLSVEEIVGKAKQQIKPITTKLPTNLKVPSKSIEQSNILSQPTTPKEYKSTSEIPTPIAELKNTTPTNKKSIFSKFYTRIVDSKNPLKPLGDKTYRLATNSNNSSNVADYIVHKGLTDSKTGKVIGKSLKEIADIYPKGQEAEFEKYMRFRHNVGRTTEGKPIYSDFTPEQSTQAYKAYEKEHPEWKTKADEIINWIDSFQKEWAVKTGITSEELYNGLRKMYPDYIPTNRVFSDLESGIVKQGGKGFVDQSTPLSRATGSDRNLTPTMENLVNIVNRTVKTAKYNEVGQSLLKSIREKPSTLAEIIPEGTPIKPNVNNVVSVLENGKPVNIQINDKSLLDALQGMTKQKGAIEETARKVTNLYTGLITHKNPLFALKNLARDIPTAYINGSEKNPITFLKDLSVAGKDIVGNTKINQQYKGLGGGGSNFMAGNAEKTAQTLNKNPNVIKKTLNGIENFNNLMESAPRLAEFKRVLAKTGDVQQALYAANDVTVNFSRGGDITKTINSVVPFSNASVQGLDKLARSLDPRNPAKMAGTLIKGGIAITAPTMFFDYLNKDNENYKSLDNRTKDNYYVFYYGPKSGNSIKLPKTRELGVLFGSLFERLHRQNQGEENTFKGFGNTARTNFAPTNPFENNIFTPIVTALPSNKDFANRDIVPRWMKDQNLSPKYQYDEKTTEIAKKIGELTNISPKQIDYLAKSYLGVLAQIGQPLNTKGGKPLDAITSSYKADSNYSNQALTDFYDNLDMLKQNAADNNFVNEIPSKRITKEERIRGQFTKSQKKISDINKKIKNTTDKDEINSLRQAIIDIAKTSNNRLK